MMKSKLTLAIALLMAFACKPYERNENGVTVRIKSQSENTVTVIRAEVISDHIIRIQSSPTKELFASESLMIDSKREEKKVKWYLSEEGDELLISTSKIRARINRTNGLVLFTDLNNQVILKETAASFKPVNFENREYFTISEVFDSPADEAFYGLGQHQNGQMNYKGDDVNLTQHNIVSVVPFLVSNKGYGILWDNYSRTFFGDPREYQSLKGLTLYDENGKSGGITSTWYADRSKKKIVVQKTENDIYYKYIDQQKLFPEGFPMQDGLVEWNGFIESDETGLHKFMIYSGGYMKIWVNNQLIYDCWRQTWNPWSRKFKVAMEKGVKIPIRIEWIPDGGESYIALEYLTPYPDEKQNQLALTSEAANKIDYYFIAGANADEIISGYRYLTGKSQIMPKWAMGLWQSRERYKTQDEIISTVSEYRKRGIPLDNIVLDWHYWDTDKWGDHNFERSRFPDPEGMMNTLHNDLHARLMISVWAKYYENTKNYQTMKDNGWLYMENINNRQKDWVGPGYVSTFYDAFNPDARAEFWKQLNDSLYSKGVDAWWLDATEPDVLSNTSIEARKKLMSPTAIGTASEYFNAFSLQQTKGVYEGQRSVNPDKRVFILTRSAYAGQQRYASATWSGDIVSRWSDLKEQIAAGMNFSISGIPYWTTDIGGFSLEKRYENPNAADLEEWRELNLRWYQFGVFCPLFRIHGQYPYREIYHVSPQGHPVYNSMVYYDKLRYRLMPYIYSLAGMTYHNDYTIMRALVMDYASDKNVLHINDEFMFGPNLLVCPVTQYKAKQREVYFPANSGWYDLLSGKYFEGGKSYTVDAPLNKIPVFAKAGAIIPVGPEIQYTDEKLADPISLFVYAGASGEFTLYEDEGTSYDYEKGMFSKIHFTYNNQSGELTIADIQGQYPGMLKDRVFNVVLIKPDTNLGIDDAKQKAITVKYKGKKITAPLL